VEQHVILIDDARLFTGEWDYPGLEDLLATVNALGQYDADVSADVVRLTPRAHPSTGGGQSTDARRRESSRLVACERTLRIGFLPR
jgi:hypothetical protein